MRLQSFLMIGIVGLGLGIPATWAQTRIEQRLLTPAGTSFLGVGIQEISNDRAKELKLPEEAGVEITSVEANSPAASAGLKVGDVILQYNSQRLEGVDQFQRMVRETPAGREVKLQVFRAGATQTVTAKVGSRAGLLTPRSSLVFPTEPPRLVNPPRVLLAPGATAMGIQAETVDGQLADFFGVKEGVLVRSVEKGSAAEKAGIKAGDVITRVADSTVATPADITRRLRANQSTPVTLMRDHREITVNVTGSASTTVERF